MHSTGITTDRLARVIDALRQRGREPRRSGAQWQALCPAHDDRNPSLSISVGDDGRVLLRCHAGCPFGAIRDSLGLTASDVGPETNGHCPTAATVLPAGGKRQNGRQLGRIVATYDYRDEDRQLLYHVVRFEPKEFRQRRPSPNGGWIWNLDGVRRILYRLPELLAADPNETVFIVEGEKDVERLRGLGLVATTCSEGAEKWKNDYNESLRGRRVVILPDNDTPGMKHAQQVAAALAGVAKEARIVELPGLPAKGDVSDWLDRGNSVSDLISIVEKTPPFRAEAQPSGLIRLSDVQPEELVFLWHNRIPIGSTTMLVGGPGLGKSLLTLDLAARVSQGWPMPGCEVSTCDPGEVVMLSTEDHLAQTIRPRAEAAGANLERIAFITDVHALDSDFPQLERYLRSMKRLKLVAIDPITAVMGNTDAHKNSPVRQCLSALGRLAEELGFALLLVTHFNKSQTALGLNRVLGSIAFSAMPRSVLGVERDKRDSQRRIVRVMKSNVSRIPSALAYRVISSQLPEIGRLEWETGEVELADDEATDGMASDGGESRAEITEAVEWLAGMMENGPVSAKVIHRQATEDGISRRTLNRAKEALKIKPKKGGFGQGGSWTWYPTSP